MGFIARRARGCGTLTDEMAWEALERVVPHVVIAPGAQGADRPTKR